MPIGTPLSPLANHVTRPDRESRNSRSETRDPLAELLSGCC
jgi:hypothetical protein